MQNSTLPGMPEDFIVQTGATVDDILHAIGMPLEKYRQVNDCITKTPEGHWVLENMGFLDRLEYRLVGWGAAPHDKRIRLPRLSYMLSRGIILPPWKTGHPEVCHECFLKECFAPEHLRLDIRLSNATDKWSNRWAPSGEDHFRSKLTNADVEEIFRLCWHSDAKYEDIAAQFGISPTRIATLRDGKDWKHITKPLLEALPPGHKPPYRAHPQAKLTPQQARELYDLAKSGARWRHIKDTYPICYNTFNNIKHKKVWTSIHEEQPCRT